MMMALNRRRVVVGILVTLGVLVFLVAGAGLWFMSRYVEYESVDSERVATRFAAARATARGQTPLLEYQGMAASIVRRNPTAPRQSLQHLHFLAYDPREEELTRVEIPAYVLRIITLGGRRPVMGEGLFGSPEERLTLEDLERHGPGLILDTSGALIGPVIAASALFGDAAPLNGRMLVWTD